MDSMKMIVDVELEEGMTHEAAIEAGMKEAAKAADEHPEIGEVEEVKFRGSRQSKEIEGLQILAEIIEKQAEFPPKHDDDDSDHHELPDEVKDVTPDHDEEKKDDSDALGMIHDIIGQLQDVAKSLGNGEEPEGDEHEEHGDVKPPVPPMGGPAGPPKPPPMLPGKKPPFMSKTEIRTLPKEFVQTTEENGNKTSQVQTISHEEALSDANQLPRRDRSLRGYKLAKLDESKTHYTAVFTR